MVSVRFAHNPWNYHCVDRAKRKRQVRLAWSHGEGMKGGALREGTTSSNFQPSFVAMLSKCGARLLLCGAGFKR